MFILKVRAKICDFFSVRTQKWVHLVYPWNVFSKKNKNRVWYIKTKGSMSLFQFGRFFSLRQLFWGTFGRTLFFYVILIKKIKIFFVSFSNFECMHIKDNAKLYNFIHRISIFKGFGWLTGFWETVFLTGENVGVDPERPSTNRVKRRRGNEVCSNIVFSAFLFINFSPVN